MIEIRISKSIYGGWNWHLYIDSKLVMNNDCDPLDSPVDAAANAEEYIIHNGV
tara:strand:+ start:402 stop:560 length:159 start_codon:yes stop_codon:yes gene_type:complete